MEFAPMEELDRRPTRILLVEDEFFVRVDIAAALRGSGFHVVEAVTADEAWVFLEAGELPDLLLTDVRTPGDLNGLTLAERVRSRLPNLPIIIASADITSEKEATRIGKFVSKPYDIQCIVQLLANIAGEPLK